MNIVMLGHKRIPSREGGIEIVVEELSTRLVSRGHLVTCLNRKGSHVSGKKFDNIRMNEYKGVSLKTVATIDRKGIAAMTASVTGAINAAFGKYDIAHFHAEGPCAMIWLPKLFGKRCIATIHGLDHKREKWGKFAGTYIMLGEKAAVKFADEIIVLSKDVEKYFLETYGRKTNYIPNGVVKPKKVECREIYKKYKISKDEYILFLARLVPEKGAHYLIEAFKGVKTNKKLIIAGGASDTNEYISRLKNMAENDERIIFTGFIQGRELEEMYSNAYLYVLPSDLEGMPLSLLEAMSYGNCCLVSDISECTDVVEENALVFKKGSIEDLSDKLKYSLENVSAVNAFKANASDFICKKYNWDAIVDQTIKLYK